MYAGSSRLDDVEFLIRSTNRMDVLAAIHETPRTRQALREETEFSRVTLSRILGDLSNRGWITRQNDQYEISAEGAVVYTEVRRVFANLDAVDALGETLRWLPTDQFDFELERLADATVMAPDTHDLTAQARWVADHVQGADRVRSVGAWVADTVLEAIVESTVGTDRHFECVVTAEVLERLDHSPERLGAVRALLEAEDTAMYRYDGDDLATTMSILPDGVLLCGRDTDQALPEAVATADDEVVSWANARFESLRADSTRVETDRFTA